MTTAAPARPESLTQEHALAVLPTMDIDAEWQRKHDAGELPEGLMGLRGMLALIWPAETLTKEEAAYIIWLKDQGSMRWLAEELTGDDNQIFGMFLIEAAERTALDAEQPQP